MADQGNYLAGMLVAGENPGTDVIGNLNRGMDFGQNIQNIPMQNMYRQQKMQEMEKQKQVDAAIKQYGQTGDIKTLQALDPTLAANAMKANDYINSQPPESVKDMTSAYEQLGRIGPMVNQQNWPDVRKRMMAAHPKLSANDLPPENATGDQIFKFVNAVPLLNAQLKLAGQAPKVLKGGDILAGPRGDVLAQAPLNPLQQAQALKAETGAQKDFADVQDPGRKWKPEILMPLSGKGPAISWKPGTPIPEGYGPAKQGKSASQSTDDDIDSMVQGLKEGTIAPSLLSKRAIDYNRIIARAQKQGIDVRQLETQYYGAKRWLSSLSSPQQARMEISGTRVIHTIDELKRLSSEMSLSGFHPLNYVELESKVKTAGNTKEGQLATKYITTVNDLKELMATAAAGGYAPTESAWKLANQQINSNFGVKQMHSALDELGTLMKINVNAGKELRAQAMQGDRGGTQEAGGKPKVAQTIPAPGGGNATFTGNNTPDGFPIYKLPDGTLRPWKGEQ